VAVAADEEVTLNGMLYAIGTRWFEFVTLLECQLTRTLLYYPPIHPAREVNKGRKGVGGAEFR
jgi:hypothetical protein